MKEIQIETERLILRPLREGDAADMYAYASDPEVGPNAGWKPHENPGESREIIQSMIRSWEEGTELNFAIVPREIGKVVGTIGVGEDGGRPKVPHVLSLGYAMGKAYWGRGYMTEAAEAVIDYAFSAMDCQLLTVNHYPENHRSKRVIEKCGFTYDGTHPMATVLYDGTVRDHCCYSMTDFAYRQLREKRKERAFPCRSNEPLILAMVGYEAGDVSKVNHFLKVYAFAKTIGEGEHFSPELQQLTETAAIVHDIGIKPSMEKYGNADGPNQEREGAPIAREMLTKLGYPEKTVERVSFLVGRHHTYSNIDGPDYQALVEADFLVNIFEGGMERSAIEHVKQSIFKTATGTRLLDDLFLRQAKA